MAHTDTPPAAWPTSDTEECAACGTSFPTLAEVFSHPCSAITPPAPFAIAGYSIDAPERGDGSGRRTQVEGPTDKQVGFARRLGATDDQIAAASTKRAASTLIEALLAAQPAKVDAPASHRPNRYEARCATCGTTVAAEVGSLTKEAGKWITRHLGTCPVAEAAPVAQVSPVTEGWYTLDGDIYKVQVAHHGSGNLYAKRLTDEAGTWVWTYTPGGVRKLATAEKLTTEQARAFGQLYGVCCCCGKVLTDERSIEAGIGPVCGRRLEELGA